MTEMCIVLVVFSGFNKDKCCSVIPLRLSMLSFTKRKIVVLVWNIVILERLMEYEIKEGRVRCDVPCYI